MQTYPDHERVESVIVDAVRYSKALGQGAGHAAAEVALVGSMIVKLRLAREVWGQSEPVDDVLVEAALRGRR